MSRYTINANVSIGQMKTLVSTSLLSALAITLEGRVLCITGSAVTTVMIGKSTPVTGSPGKVGVTWTTVEHVARAQGMDGSSTTSTVGAVQSNRGSAIVHLG